MPLDEALTYAIQIAEALRKAHRQGVVHRDLKPGNVMLTKSGAKLLDFGLTKLAGTVGGAPDAATLSSSPTEQKSLTAAGTILGTFQYMAPEQLEGRHEISTDCCGPLAAFSCRAGECADRVGQSVLLSAL